MGKTDGKWGRTMKQNSFLKFIRFFCLAAAGLLLLAATLVFLFDPFYHFHGPLPGLKAVVTKSEYQCIGTIRNFDYDSVLAGSSTAENYHNGWFDEGFGARTVKAIKSSGTTADLKFYLDEAFATHEVKNVFYSLDLFALDGDPDSDFVDESMPLYLYDHNPFNDIRYLLNRDVLFEDIPYLLAMTAAGYDEGTSYNWWEDKTFSQEEALKHYVRPAAVAEPLTRQEWQPRVDGNLDLLAEMAEAHPETQFYFFLPPYSMLWWDNVCRSGQGEEYLYARRAAMERLCAFDNVRLYDFQGEEEIVLNLDNYMDPIHFSADVNRWIALEAESENSEYLVTPDNGEEKLARVEALVREKIPEKMEGLFGETDP